jgi:hypothetical protein
MQSLSPTRRSARATPSRDLAVGVGPAGDVEVTRAVQCLSRNKWDINCTLYLLVINGGINGLSVHPPSVGTRPRASP